MREPQVTLDAIDITILGMLQADASIANAELASRIGMSPSACLSRTKRLRKAGVIRRYTAIIDQEQVGLPITVFTFVGLGRHDRDAAESFLERVHEMPHVMECYHVTGQADYMLKVVAPDIASYRDFLMDVLVPTPDLSHIESRIVLRAEKRETSLPLSVDGGSPC